MELELEEFTKEIIGASFEVYNELGYGFLEKVYNRAMVVELTSRDLNAVSEAPITVRYKGEMVGEYFADLFVNESVVVELKVAQKYNSNDEPQLLNELKATGISVGLLINFGKSKVEFKRFVRSQKH
ncbi:GxxExxY protein [Cerasicoccus maritimus]|uniref:GxxExxY protein n=1 Tax=Cerasicoccus maritimus TaxID=490089 RepID=UPI0028529BA4|nr:GxxExxY protein [Cerasicoccus maritimus]